MYKMLEGMAGANRAYYGEFEEFELETPMKRKFYEIIFFGWQLLWKKKVKGARLEWRALKSFLSLYEKNCTRGNRIYRANIS